MRNYFVAFSLASLFACSQTVTHPLPTDHFVAPKNSKWFADSPQPQPFSIEGCRARISDVICLVEPEVPGDTAPRACIQGVDLSPAINSLQTIYDNYPEALQKVFCTLSHIYLEKKSVGTAYAGSSGDGSMAVLGFRAELLLEPTPSLSKWVSWKEQLNFGGAKDYTTREDLVKIEASTTLAAPASDFVYYVIAHEFGHVLDFKYKVNDWICNDASDECEPRPGSWNALSWAKSYPKLEPTVQDPWGLMAWIPSATSSFEHRDELCFYACADDHGSPALMLPLYTNIMKVNFLTTYSSTNSWDDFAETVAFYAGTRYINLNYAVTLPDGTRFDLVDKYKNDPVFRSKRDWVENFFKKLENPPQP
ncbi:MAG: hypothetical protein ABIR96_06970 [Bdellovibrionota bacterium]